jgi:hypothetical protein
MFWVNASEDPGQAELLTPRILYKVHFRKPCMLAQNLDSTAAINYFNALSEKVIAGALKAYTFSGDQIADMPISGDEVDKMLRSHDTITLTRSDPPYDAYDTLIANFPDPPSTFSFIEEWSVDTLTFTFKKEVVGISQTYSILSYYEITGYQPVYTVYFKKPWAPFKRDLLLSH